jgi:hypothetical protein
MTDLSFLIHKTEQERLKVRRKSYLFRRAPRKRALLRALWLGLIGGLAIAPPAFAQVTTVPAAHHGSVSISASRVFR